MENCVHCWLVYEIEHDPHQVDEIKNYKVFLKHRDAEKYHVKSVENNKCYFTSYEIKKVELM